MKKRILIYIFALLILILLWSQLFSVFDITRNPVSILYKPYAFIPMCFVTLGVLSLVPKFLCTNSEITKISSIAFSLFMILSFCGVAVGGLVINDSRQRADDRAKTQSIETRFSAQQFFSIDNLQVQPTTLTSKRENAFYGIRDRFAYYFEQNLTAQNLADCHISYEIYVFENLSDKEYDKIETVLVQRYINKYPEKTEQAEILNEQTAAGKISCILQDIPQNEIHSFYYAAVLRSENELVVLKMRVYAAGDFTKKNQLQENLDAFFLIHRVGNHETQNTKHRGTVPLC